MSTLYFIPIGARVRVNCPIEPDYHGKTGILTKIVDNGFDRGLDGRVIWHHHIALDDGGEFVGQRDEYESAP